MSDGYLITPVEAKDWGQLCEAVGGVHSWFWMDYLGPHVAQPLPELEPRTTHLWGWTAGSWYRLRPDSRGWVGARLIYQQGIVGNTSQVKQLRGASFRGPSGGVRGDEVPHVQSVISRSIVSPVVLSFIELELDTSRDS